MQTVTTIRLDIAKSVFQVHGVDAAGQCQLKRRYVRPTKVAALALANKLARMAWALMLRGERYNYPVALRP
jgi:hypothetical protein